MEEECSYLWLCKIQQVYYQVLHAAVNGLFGKLLNLASEQVILELVRAKCIPICYMV